MKGAWLLLCFLWYTALPFCRAFIVLLSPGSSAHALPVCRGSSLCANNDRKSFGNEETQNLLDRAKQLREEAQALESQLRLDRGTVPNKPSGQAKEAVPPTIIQYDKIAGSTWTITYRFADEPAKKSIDNSDDKVVFYRGKMSLKFRPDGYTDLISEKDDNNQIEIVKVWGWDEEISQEDSKRYILFSIDAKTPTKPDKIRFYFQARLEFEKNAAVLKEGTVTIKQDLAETKRMMNFGLFSPAGILAEFRYVGDFLAKPTPETPT